MGKKVLTVLSYILITFPLGYVWNYVIFLEANRRFGLYREQPIAELGALAMLLQGLALSFLYPRHHDPRAPLRSAFAFSAWLAAFFGSGTVIGIAAKARPNDLSGWLIHGAGFTAVHFALVALALAWVHGREET